jgi:hypothetical protein
MAEGLPNRDPDLVRFLDCTPLERRGTRHWFSRSQNAVIEWVEAGADPAPFEVASDEEIMVLALTAGAAIQGADQNARAGARSLFILPPGRFSIGLDRAGSCAVFASARSDVTAGSVINSATYAQPDARVAAIGAPFRRKQGADRIHVIALDAVAAPPDNPRLKMFQSATLSINWVEYAGPRDRTTLSPHSHADLEQCSLAAAGDFIHHLRVPWAKDANLWRDDRHVNVPSPSVLVIPVHLVHTTEGIGAGQHLLIDVFSPPRRDFIAKGWVANAPDYESPA